MEYKLIIKNYNSLYTIYFTKLCKVLVGVVSRVIIVLNFYIYKELFSLINFAFKIFLRLYIKPKGFKSRL